MEFLHRKILPMQDLLYSFIHEKSIRVLRIFPREHPKSIAHPNPASSWVRGEKLPRALPGSFPWTGRCVYPTASRIFARITAPSVALRRPFHSHCGKFHPKRQNTQNQRCAEPSTKSLGSSFFRWNSAQNSVFKTYFPLILCTVAEDVGRCPEQSFPAPPTWFETQI